MIINIKNYGLYYEPNTIKVYLDGEEQTLVTAFDIEEGWVEVYESIVQGQELIITRKVGVVTADGKRDELDEHQ